MNTNLLRTIIIAVAASNAIAAEIPAGTHLLLRMENTINTKTAKPGDGVHLLTVSPISVGGKIVVPVGSYAQGVVTEAKRSGIGHRPGELQIQLVKLLLPSGEVLNVSPHSSSLAPQENSLPTARRNVRPDPLAGVVITGGILGGTLLGAQLGGTEDAAGIGALAGLGAGIAAIILPAILAHGREVELRQGSTVDVVFDQPETIE